MVTIEKNKRKNFITQIIVQPFCLYNFQAFCKSYQLQLSFAEKILTQF